jgi:hypothetical protein
VRIDLLGNALGVEQTSLQITFPGTQTCVGTVTRLDNQGFAGRCSTADGEQRSVTADWRVSADSVKGRLALT